MTRSTDARTTSMTDPEKFMARRKLCLCNGANDPHTKVLPPDGHGEMWNGSAR